MRTATVVVLALLAALAASSAIPERNRHVADKDTLTKQKQVLHLLTRVHQPNYLADLIEISHNYDPEAHLEQYKDPVAVKKLLAWYHEGELLQHDQPFSVFYHKHIEQAITIFDVLYGAQDFDTFYKTAAYLRDRVNVGQFIYAFSIAVIHRPDTQDVVLPPAYEVYPELFVPNTVIHKAVEARLRNQEFPVTINEAQVENISRIHTHPWAQHAEEQLQYFTNDVGLSAYHTYLHYEYPFWFNAQKYNVGAAPRRGELFYYSLHQLYARYQLERLSHGLPDVEPVSYDIHGHHLGGYAPHLSYHNGQAMPARPDGIVPQDVDIVDIESVRDIEYRLKKAIDLGVAFDTNINKVALTEEEGIDVLGNIVAGNADSVNPRFYHSLYRALNSLFGHIVDPHHEHGVAPSALENFETALRDPAYYRIVARILDLFYQYKQLLHSYTRDELAFPGVKIESVDVDKLVTYVDDFVYDVNGAIDVASAEEADKLDIRVRQPRLNHKPYSIRVSVDSDKATRVAVRVFLGPKYDWLGQPLSFEQRRNHFVEIDRFPYEVQSGKTVIERSSRDSTAVVPDQTITRVLFKKVNDAIQGGEPYYVDSSSRHCGFPERLLLPKGTKQGLPLSLFVVVTPYNGDSTNTHRADISCGAGFGFPTVDNKPFGYPLDRVIKNEHEFLQVPNVYIKDVIVFHKKQEDINKA